MNHYHCDLSALAPVDCRNAVTASRLIREPGLYERTFTPQNAAFWVKNEDDAGDAKRPAFDISEFK